jgi:hypothetical protein
MPRFHSHESFGSTAARRPTQAALRGKIGRYVKKELRREMRTVSLEPVGYVADPFGYMTADGVFIPMHDDRAAAEPPIVAPMHHKSSKEAMEVDKLDPTDTQLPGEHAHVDGDMSARKITIVRLSGAVAFGPRELDSSFTIGVLKALFDKGRPKKLMLGIEVLDDAASLKSLPQESLLNVAYSSALVSTTGTAELETLKEQYNIWETIGEGTYSRVYKAARIGTEPAEFVAIKQTKLEDAGVPATALREIAILKQCSHPNVVVLHDVVCSRNYLYLVMEHLDLDLKAYLKACGAIGNSGRFRAFVHMCFQGLLYCHSRAIMHRDIKPENILVDAGTMQLKIADFGLARNFAMPSRAYTHEVVTLWYRPPEILLGEEKYGPAVDIWSMGCVVAEMATAKALFPGDSEIGTIFKFFAFLGTPDETMWPGISQLRDYRPTFPKWVAGDIEGTFASSAPVLQGPGANFIKNCLCYNVADRPSARHCVQHELLEGLMVD